MWGYCCVIGTDSRRDLRHGRCGVLPNADRVPRCASRSLPPVVTLRREPGVCCNVIEQAWRCCTRRSQIRSRSFSSDSSGSFPARCACLLLVSMTTRHRHAACGLHSAYELHDEQRCVSHDFGLFVNGEQVSSPCCCCVLSERRCLRARLSCGTG